jgi:hypothetical protein
MHSQVITTVTTRATSYDLVALGDLKSDLQTSAATSDDYLKRTISAASAAVAQYCNRVFAVESVSDRFIASGRHAAFPIRTCTDRLQLSRWPIVAVASVTLTLRDGSTQTLASGTDFLVDASVGQLIRLNVDGRASFWPAGGLEVAYSAGYAPIPYDIQDAVTRLVKARVASRMRDPLLRSENLPGLGANTYWVGASPDAGNLPPDVANALDSYRAPVIA